MAKQGMKHYYTRHRKHEAASVPQAGTGKIPAAFPAIDNDLAAENMVNDFDMTAADLQDLQK